MKTERQMQACDAGYENFKFLVCTFLFLLTLLHPTRALDNMNLEHDEWNVSVSGHVTRRSGLSPASSASALLP